MVSNDGEERQKQAARWPGERVYEGGGITTENPERQKRGKGRRKEEFQAAVVRHRGCACFIRERRAFPTGGGMLGAIPASALLSEASTTKQPSPWASRSLSQRHLLDCAPTPWSPPHLQTRPCLPSVHRLLLKRASSVHHHPTQPALERSEQHYLVCVPSPRQQKRASLAGGVDGPKSMAQPTRRKKSLLK